MVDDKKCEDCAKGQISDIYSLLRQEVREIRETANENKEGLSRRISERIPIRHALLAVLAMIGIITTILTVSSRGVDRIEDKVVELSKEVAVMSAISKERKHQQEFQGRLLEVLIESLEEKQPGAGNRMSNHGPAYGKPGP